MHGSFVIHYDGDADSPTRRRLLLAALQQDGALVFCAPTKQTVALIMPGVGEVPNAEAEAVWAEIVGLLRYALEGAERMAIDIQAGHAGTTARGSA